MNRTPIAAAALLALALPVLALGQQPPAARPAPAQAALPLRTAAPTTNPDIDPEIFQERQMSLMEARILSRQGDFPKSLKLYEKLRAEYPDDQEIYEDFLETLVSNREYERVLFELVKFRKKFGVTSRQERIEAGLYSELSRPQYSLEILERAMRGNPGDTGLWSDVAIQRQATRDVNGAIQAFSAVLDADPDNQQARDALHGLLLEQRPRLEAGVGILDQGHNTVTNSFTLGYSMMTGDNTRMFVDFLQTHVHRPTDQADAKTVDADIGIVGVRLDHDLRRDLTLEAGIQSYMGAGDGVSPMAGLRYDMGDWGRSRINYAFRQPWYDDIDAARMHGFRNRLMVEYDLPFRDVWVAHAGYQLDNYGISEKSDLGYRWQGTASLTRRIWQNPDVFLTYTFERAEMQYAHGDYQPWQLVRREESHMGTATISKQLLPWLTASVNGGIKHDYEVKAESLVLSPQFIIQPIERMRITLGWDYSTQNTALVKGGETSNYYTRFVWVW